VVEGIGLVQVTEVIESEFVHRISFLPLGGNRLKLVGPPGTVEKLKQYIAKIEQGSTTQEVNDGPRE